ncbi:signal peptidase I [Paenibacillus sediminis]|uniref:Signal peptidase I n=1 Tax=Paenibacillus sediminis TaxID=664909 RepID=A0ABS4H0Y0_9BACL|nr:signal peptidase I [Paenibacillus sediminis]MBP1936126.1 signal peptidase I [Paenibacillus sediminis]
MKVLKEIGTWLSSIGIGFILTLFVGIFVFQPYKVDGHSMDPTLHDKERIYVSKLSHTFSKEPDYGDIVVIDSRIDRKRSFKDSVIEHPLIQFIMGKNTKEDHTFYVKRVIGKPGDVLEFKDHKVYRNGVALQEPYLKETMNFVSNQKWIVPKDHIFVMGDNRNNSNDSRNIGYIPLDHVMGIKKFP